MPYLGAAWTVIDRCNVQANGGGGFADADDRGRDVARERCQNGVELTGSDGYR